MVVDTLVDFLTQALFVINDSVVVGISAFVQSNPVRDSALHKATVARKSASQSSKKVNRCF